MPISLFEYEESKKQKEDKRREQEKQKQNSRTIHSVRTIRLLTCCYQNFDKTIEIKGVTDLRNAVANHKSHRTAKNPFLVINAIPRAAKVPRPKSVR